MSLHYIALELQIFHILFRGAIYPRKVTLLELHGCGNSRTNWKERGGRSKGMVEGDDDG
jgi:hypothetical protein